MVTEGQKQGAPVEADTGSASRNDQLHKATKLQSSVRPEEYPLAERQAQTEAATGRPERSASEKIKW